MTVTETYLYAFDPLPSRVTGDPPDRSSEPARSEKSFQSQLAATLSSGNGSPVRHPEFTLLPHDMSMDSIPESMYKTPFPAGYPPVNEGGSQASVVQTVPSMEGNSQASVVQTVPSMEGSSQASVVNGGSEPTATHPAPDQANTQTVDTVARGGGGHEAQATADIGTDSDSQGAVARPAAAADEATSSDSEAQAVQDDNPHDVQGMGAVAGQKTPEEMQGDIGNSKTIDDLIDISELGFYNADIDGIWKKHSKEALRDFKKAHGLRYVLNWDMKAQKTLFKGTGQ